MKTLPEANGRVLLIGWDAADWKVISPMLDRGEMPHLEKLVGQGVMGDLLTLQPVLSPMLWNSIATGHWSEQHGIHGFTEVDPATNTVRSVSSTSRKCKALWNMVTQAGGRAHAVNWYASHPAEPINGICVTDMLAHMRDRPALPSGTIHPSEVTEEFASLRLRTDEIDGNTLQLFVPLLAEVDQENDKHLLQLAKLLAESFTVHSAATKVLEDSPWNLAAVYYPGIDHFSHGFMNFHPPQMPGISDERFRLYSKVINGAYRLHDLFLGRLLELAGPGATVVLLSDHGFHSDHLRPARIPDEPVGPAVQHRPHGILVMAGDGLKQDERIYGADLLDIAPTVLTLLGLPIGEDMPGRVLTDAFVRPPSIQKIPSWEHVAGADGRHPVGFSAPSHDHGLILEQFAALGYLDLNELRNGAGPEMCVRENTWSLAQSLVQSGKYERAADCLFELCKQWPQRGDFALLLAEVLRRLGQPAEARRLVESLVACNPNAPAARYLLGIAYLEEKRFSEAVEQLRTVGAEYGGRSELHQRLGSAFFRMGECEEAEAAYQRSIVLDPHAVSSWVGLARCAVRKSNWSCAEDYAIHAVGLDFHRPLAHMILGLARMRQGKHEEADLALRVACKQASGWMVPRRLRSRLWHRHAGVEAREAQSELKVAMSRQVAARRQNQEFLTPTRLETLDYLTKTYRELKLVSRDQVQEEKKQEITPLELTIVTGLPRSGTSLMMQMLQAAGMPILTDGARSADIDNPEGYLEWEEIKTLPKHPEVLASADGKGVKVISSLLPYLPLVHKYKVIFLDRPIEEILASQQKMRDRRGEGLPPDSIRLQAAMAGHRAQALANLKRLPSFQVMVVPYPELIADPETWTVKVAEFLEDRLPHPGKLVEAVRPELYRNRAS